MAGPSTTLRVTAQGDELSAIGDQLLAATRMYRGLKYLYRTTDQIIHTSPEGARAQARHLADSSIEKITCKTGKITLEKP